MKGLDELDLVLFADQPFGWVVYAVKNAIFMELIQPFILKVNLNLSHWELLCVIFHIVMFLFKIVSKIIFNLI